LTKSRANFYRWSKKASFKKQFAKNNSDLESFKNQAENMEGRKKDILEAIVKEHVATGSPVGSSFLVEKCKLDCSSATVRNVMVELEEDGYIMQPHTSAGRVPTEKAYNLFLEELQKGQKRLKKLRDKELKDLDDSLVNFEESSLREAAKALAALTQTAVFWAFHKNNLYYTGLSNLFHQPEFANSGLVYNISAVIDRMDEIIDRVFESVGEKPEVLIGKQNPFGDFCGSILAKYRCGTQTGMVGIIGPMRMDYERNLGVVEHIIKKINIK
jgi:heat-inducible transcriptional repressor